MSAVLPPHSPSNGRQWSTLAPPWVEAKDRNPPVRAIRIQRWDRPKSTLCRHSAGSQKSRRLQRSGIGRQISVSALANAAERAYLKFGCDRVSAETGAELLHVGPWRPLEGTGLFHPPGCSPLANIASLRTEFVTSS